MFQRKKLVAAAAALLSVVAAGHANALTVQYNTSGVTDTLAGQTSYSITPFTLTEASLVNLSITSSYIDQFFTPTGGSASATTLVSGIQGFTVTLAPLSPSASTVDVLSTVTFAPYGSVTTGQHTTTYSLTNAYLAAGSYSLVIAGDMAKQGSFTGQLSTVAVPVPEPETYAMMLAGLGALGFLASRRRG